MAVQICYGQMRFNENIQVFVWKNPENSLENKSTLHPEIRSFLKSIHNQYLGKQLCLELLILLIYSDLLTIQVLLWLKTAKVGKHKQKIKNTTILYPSILVMHGFVGELKHLVKSYVIFKVILLPIFSMWYIINISRFLRK